MQRSIKRTLLRMGMVPVALLSLLGGCMLLDRIALSRAQPPASMKTIEDFRLWKQNSMMRQGSYENSGVTYIVMFGPAGAWLSSGPAAYLFDERGEFVDWTPDMGDCYTVRNRFNLMGGRVVNLERRVP